MKLKSLLIGSAALAAAATGARAADPIVVPEPEPMEYVRICDVYGAGFFYIPGTETCLQISGMVRYQIDYSDGDMTDQRGWDKLARVEVNFDARSETEYGTLGAFIRLRGDTRTTAATVVPGFNRGGAYSNGGGGGVNVQQAIISLGGLSMGFSDTLYDGGIAGDFDSGGGDRVHFINYTFAGGNGFSATVALEEADRNYDWTPNVVGRAGITQGWGSATLYAAYDATAEEFAVKGIVNANLTDRVTASLIATYESGVNFYSVNPFGGTGLTFNPTVGAEWTLGASLGFQATEKLNIVAGAQYFSEVGHGAPYTIGAGVANAFGLVPNTVYNLRNIDAWKAGVTFNYAIVENFNATLAVNYTKFDTPAGVADPDQWHGFLRLQRNF